jgi:hypothetical protein
MSPADRQDWIERHLQAQPPKSHVDVLNSGFVDTFVQATGATAIVQPYGANKCPTLGRDLAAMVHCGILKRHRTGITGLAGMGFPRWVWCYSLRNDERIQS